VDARLRIKDHHTAITTIVREGSPANEILSEADQGDYDVIVVGANEAHDMKHGMLGSVSSKVAWCAPCSVLIARVPE
jgi:nucleotide-binding universal stress UspA family protein